MDFRVCVIIVNYHCQDLVCHCLDSLKKMINDDLVYIVVDNSTIEDTDRLKMMHTDVNVFRPNSNLGFAGGCNMGIKYALNSGAAYILIMNPDTRVEHNFLGPLIDVLEKHPNLGLVGPMIIEDSKERKIWAAGGKLNWWLGAPKHVLDDRTNYQEETVRVPFLSGCCMLLRAEAIRQVGLMDDRYFLYFEDADYVQRFLRADWEVAYVPAAEILHAPSSTTGFQSELYIYYFSRNRIWFMRRWARWYHFVVFMTYTTLVKLPGAVIVFGLIRRQPKLVRAFFRGYWDGLCGMRHASRALNVDFVTGDQFE